MLPSLLNKLTILPVWLLFAVVLTPAYVYAVDAGIGLELETAGIRFEPVDECSEADTVASIQKTIDGRKGNDWHLTGDTLEDAGLTAEYIFDGKMIKLDSKRLAKAAEEVANNYWQPGADSENNVVEIEDAPCRKWRIVQPEEQSEACGIKFSPQVTAPIPLEAVYEYFELCYTSTEAKDGSALLPANPKVRSPRHGRRQEKVWVTPEFFQIKTDTFDAPDTDVLGFLSLVLTYIKGIEGLEPNDSPKLLSSLMPRTDFPTIYLQVRAKMEEGILGDSKKLSDLIRILVCYRNVENAGTSVALDNKYCSGDPGAPTSTGYLDKQEFYLVDDTDDAVTERQFPILDWIGSIQNPVDGTDLLSKADAELFKKSVGGLGTAVEKMYGSDREVPIFEFRNLKGKASDEWVEYPTRVEDELLKLHEKHK